MATTPRLGLPVPELDNPADVPADLAAIAAILDKSSLLDSGASSSRPAPTAFRGVYLSTDTKTVWLSDGVAWTTLGAAPGDLKSTAASTADPGWVIADGSLVPRTGLQADLFARIGVQYGAGNGSTTFQLPDLRARVPVGAGGGRSVGQSGGAETHTLAAAESGMPTHNHPIATYDNRNTYMRSAAALALGTGSGGSAVFNFIGHPVGGAPPAVEVQGSTVLGDPLMFAAPPILTQTADRAGQGAASAHNNMQPFQVVNWLIKL